jgi:hypothetical protein
LDPYVPPPAATQSNVSTWEIALPAAASALIAIALTLLMTHLVSTRISRTSSSAVGAGIR